MAEEEGSLGGVSDIVNPSALFCFDIRGFENYLSSQHFNSDSIKEGGNISNGRPSGFPEHPSGNNKYKKSKILRSGAWCGG